MKAYDKYLILNKRYIEYGIGEIFDPEYATKAYGVSFIDLTFQKHYISSLSVSIDASGAHGGVSAHFTDKGIKKLLKTNEKMQKEINDLWEEYKEDWNLAQYELDFKVVYDEPKL